MNDRVQFEVENLPHGVIVDDIGLNGVLLPEGQTERILFLSCESWVPATERSFQAVAKIDGDANPEAPISGLKSIQSVGDGDLVVTLIQLDAPVADGPAVVAVEFEIGGVEDAQDRHGKRSLMRNGAAGQMIRRGAKATAPRPRRHSTR